ncbi:hypothetical protein BH09ACT11_BH09ACT11_00770 [soil metagenome]
MTLHGQISVEWGLVGAQMHSPTDFAVVVDVLCFTTTVTVAVERGIEVLPYPWAGVADDAAREFAQTHHADLAGPRGSIGSVSLSPASMMRTASTRVVLPSPNGSSIAFALRDQGSVVLAASLRNATAVAAALAGHVLAGASVLVIAAGERWPDGSLRPAIEDLWGAGAVVNRLIDAGCEHLTPDANAAEATFRNALIRDEMLHCPSGRELLSRGFARDLDIAGRVDSSGVVPVLEDDRFSAG